MTLLLSTIVVVLFISASLAWVGVNMPHLVGLTADILEWCQSLVSVCLAYTSLFTALLLWAGAAAFTGGIIYATIKGGAGLIRGYRAINQLPLADRGLSVALIKDDSVRAAFTCGLIRPRIYISTGLISSLTRAELRAVLIHEIHHRKNRDPLRFFLASFLRDAFFYLPLGGYLAARLHDNRECAADDAVILRTGDKLGLAETLLKVALFGRGMELKVVRSASIRGSGSVEGRISRLVDGETRADRPGARVVVSSVLIAAILIFSISLPLSATAYDPGSCDMDHCSVHGSVHGGDIGDSCRVHCAVKG